MLQQTQWIIWSSLRISLPTCREKHDSHRLVTATPGSKAQWNQCHEEGKQGEGCSPHKQGQCGDLPVWDKHRDREEGRVWGRKTVKSRWDREWHRWLKKRLLWRAVSVLLKEERMRREKKRRKKKQNGSQALVVSHSNTAMLSLT